MDLVKGAWMFLNGKPLNDPVRSEVEKMALDAV